MSRAEAAARPAAIARVREAVPELGPLSAARFVTVVNEMIEACAESLGVEFEIPRGFARVGLMAAIGARAAASPPRGADAPPLRPPSALPPAGCNPRGEGRQDDDSVVNIHAGDERVEAGRRCLPPGDRE